MHADNQHNISIDSRLLEPFRYQLLPSSANLQPQIDTASPLMRAIQICYLPEQVGHCEYQVYYNPCPLARDESYLFFESRVLADLVERGEHRAAEFFGVLSHKVSHKLATARNWPLPWRNISRVDYTRSDFENFVADHRRSHIISLSRTVPHSVYGQDEIGHPGLLTVTAEILERLGINTDVRQRSRCPIYFNFFVARAAVLEEFVDRLLRPAINLILSDSGLQLKFRAKSNYTGQWPETLAALFNLPCYPLHPFFAERLINAYILWSKTPVTCFDLSQRTGWPYCLCGSCERLDAVFHKAINLFMPRSQRVCG